MLRTFVCAVLGLALCAGGVLAKDSKKEEKEITGKIKAVHPIKKTLVLTVGGKERVVEISETTRFIGPNGGESKEGIKDDRVVKGAVVKVLLATNNKTAREVHLRVRKKDTGKDKKKDKK